MRSFTICLFIFLRREKRHILHSSSRNTNHDENERKNTNHDENKSNIDSEKELAAAKRAVDAQVKAQAAKKAKKN
jgi:hypothetical protein